MTSLSCSWISEICRSFCSQVSFNTLSSSLSLFCSKAWFARKHLFSSCSSFSSLESFATLLFSWEHLAERSRSQDSSTAHPDQTQPFHWLTDPQPTNPTWNLLFQQRWARGGNTRLSNPPRSGSSISCQMPTAQTTGRVCLGDGTDLGHAPAAFGMGAKEGTGITRDPERAEGSQGPPATLQDPQNSTSLGRKMLPTRVTDL